ncbi:MAG: hypothetical protein KGY74_10920 [Candidatus Cloacimonetes bacterium]|nr:hypothetical protein [Candidatus Cloacimonadota bacterium]
MIRIKTKLTSSTIKLKNIQSLIGKDVEIIIRETSSEKNTHQWNHSGTLDLNGKLDHVDIRDYAHE